MKPQRQSFREMFRTRRGLAVEGMRFAATGCVGFTVDAALVYVMVSLGSGATVARLVSTPPAILATWFLNRAWTFSNRGSGRRKRVELIRYLAVQLIGLLANYLVYIMVIGLIGLTPINALIGLGFGACLGLVVNFTGTRLLVFGAGDGRPAH